jgi:hypothetical protein
MWTQLSSLALVAKLEVGSDKQRRNGGYDLGRKR